MGTVTETEGHVPPCLSSGASQPPWGCGCLLFGVTVTRGPSLQLNRKWRSLYCDLSYNAFCVVSIRGLFSLEAVTSLGSRTRQSSLHGCKRYRKVRFLEGRGVRICFQPSFGCDSLEAAGASTSSPATNSMSGDVSVIQTSHLNRFQDISYQVGPS